MISFSMGAPGGYPLCGEDNDEARSGDVHRVALLGRAGRRRARRCRSLDRTFAGSARFIVTVCGKWSSGNGTGIAKRRVEFVPNQFADRVAIRHCTHEDIRALRRAFVLLRPHLADNVVARMSGAGWTGRDTAPGADRAKRSRVARLTRNAIDSQSLAVQVGKAGIVERPSIAAGARSAAADIGITQAGNRAGT
jgi:hypothetical protein